MIGPTDLAPLVDDAVRHLLGDNPAEAAAVLDVIAAQGDAADWYGVCCAAAEIGYTALLVLHPEGGEATHQWAVLGTSGDPHALFASRFQAAYANGDIPLTVALFQAADTAGPRARIESVCALFAHVRALHARAAEPATSSPGGTRS
ncbi:hypothetical protein ABZ820_12810 [Streptomyces diacarni]|uniref:hypothetical protein n=1 Tax=Streptomyces diacarni TaxID=2800381 RepID=UPI0033CD1641